MHIVLKYFYTTCVQGIAYQKQLLGPKLMGLWEHPKNWDLLLIFAATEASNFNFGIQLGVGE